MVRKTSLYTPYLAFALFPIQAKAQAISSLGEGFGPEYPFKLLLALLLVLLIFFVLVWIGKRLRQLPAGKSRIRVLEGVNVGSREKLLLVEVNQQQILLGVTANSISTLHQMTETASTQSGFASVVRQQLEDKEGLQ